MKIFHFFQKEKNNTNSSCSCSKDYVSVKRIPAYHPLQNPDLRLLGELSQGLEKSGVVEDENSKNKSEKNVGIQKVDSFDEMFNEAVSAAKYEKELNPDFYSPEVEEELIKKVNNSDSNENNWNNPLIEGYFDEE